MEIKKKIEYTVIDGDEKIIITVMDSGEIEYLNIKVSRGSTLKEQALKKLNLK